MPHFQSLLLATPIECEPLKRVIAPDAASQSPLKIAQIQAIDHIHCAAEIITAAMSRVPDADLQLYASIVSALRTLERHLTGLNQF